MSSIVTAVFKATVGLLANKGRDKGAEKLKEGDVTDKKIRDLIVREVHDIKSKLDGLARKDLLVAIDAFEAGLRYLYQAIDTEAAAASTRAKERNENFKELSSPSTTAAMKTVALAAGMTNMELTEFSEGTKEALSEAKERFKMAREEATRASNNEALSTLDRITAIRYRVVATMLQSAVSTVVAAGDLSSSRSVKSALENALPECEQCLLKLHSLPDVQNNFKLELEKRLLNIKGRFGKDERREIIYAVCQVNRVIYDAAQTAGKGMQLLMLPSVDTGEDKIDPLRDPRVTKILRQVSMEHCCVTWSFGQEGEEEHSLKDPCGIATNTEGQFVVADDGDKTVKMFSSSGSFSLIFNLQTNVTDTELEIFEVTTDANSNTYVLVGRWKAGVEGWEREVQVRTKTGDLLYKFPVRRGHWRWGRRLTVSKNNVLVLGVTEVSDGLKFVVDVFEHDGRYVHSFGEGVLKEAYDITADSHGHVMVVTSYDYSVHVFTEDGTHLNKFNINTEGYDYSVACHPAGEHVVVACTERGTHRRRVDIYTKDGEFVRSVALDEERIRSLWGITVTMEGHTAVAVTARDDHESAKIIVL